MEKALLFHFPRSLFYHFQNTQSFELPSCFFNYNLTTESIFGKKSQSTRLLLLSLPILTKKKKMLVICCKFEILSKKAEFSL